MSDQLRAERRSSALLHAISTDFLLREQFVTDPAGMFSEYIGGPSNSPEANALANQLLFAIVSHPQLLRWLRTRVAVPGQDLSDGALASDLAKAVGSSGDEAIVAALIHCSATEQASIQPALALLRTLGLGLRGVGQRFGGPALSPGTELTPGPGTEFSPCTGTQFTPGTGTQYTPGTGTQSTPGTGTQSTPGTRTQSTPAGILRGWGDLQVTIHAL